MIFHSKVEFDLRFIFKGNILYIYLHLHLLYSLNRNSQDI